MFVASEYNIKDKSFAPVDKEPSVFFHHIPVFCSLYIFSLSTLRFSKVNIKSYFILEIEKYFLCNLLNSSNKDNILYYCRLLY